METQTFLVSKAQAAFLSINAKDYSCSIYSMKTIGVETEIYLRGQDWAIKKLIEYTNEAFNIK